MGKEKEKRYEIESVDFGKIEIEVKPWCVAPDEMCVVKVRAESGCERLITIEWQFVTGLDEIEDIKEQIVETVKKCISEIRCIGLP